MKKILVTGGAGYIGSHTLVDLIENGYQVISIDNLSRGYEAALDGAGETVGQKIKNYKVDLCNLNEVGAVFEENPDIAGIIHFAAYKSVPESVDKPLMYYNNNLQSLLNILQCAEDYKVKNIVFSSSCSVYGNTDVLPVTEETPFCEAESPYGRSKQIGENICRDYAKAHPDTQIILLRYFNPVGVHPSILIGDFNDKPENVVPIITQTAVGLRNTMQVYGKDYPTRDGTCIRDYIHVVDIAHAHTLAVQKGLAQELSNNCEVYNLGSGTGITVMELIDAFEKASGKKLNYNIGDRRAGDVISIYANNTKAFNELGWKPQHNIDDMVSSAWQWQLRLAAAKKAFLN